MAPSIHEVLQGLKDVHGGTLLIVAWALTVLIPHLIISCKCGPLRYRFPRLFALETCKNCSMGNIWSLVNGIWEPFWAWRRHPSGRSGGEVSLITGRSEGEFTVKSLSRAIQKKLLSSDVSEVAQLFSWNSWVPRKVNICAWRVFLDRLPTRANLVHRGIQAPGSFNPSLEDILKGITDFSEDKRVSKIFHAVCMTVIWHVWTWRNKIIHAASIEEANSARHKDNFSDVQRLSLLWIFNCAPFRACSWDLWVRQPYDLGLS
ncbi:RNA-directed DNA polymerase, eukaryota, reverse transcriptase zinc-binding domain protein [Tanacetum coccineum]